MHVSGSGGSAASGTSAGAGVIGGGHRLLFGVDVARARLFFDRVQRHRVELRGGAVQRGHRRRADAADDEQTLAIGRPLRAAGEQEIVMADHALLTAAELFHPHVRAKLAVLLRVRDPFAIRRPLRAVDVAGFALRHDVGLAALGVDHAQFVISAAPHHAPRIGRPDDAALIAIGVADLLDRLAELVGKVELFAARAVADERDPLAVRRPARVLLLPGSFRNALRLAAVGCDGEDLAVRDDGRAAVRGRKVEALRVGERDQLLLVLLGVGFNIHDDLGGLAGGGV